MKQITAIIRPERFDAVRNALRAAGAPGISVSDIEGHGKQKGIEQVWRGERFRMELIPKVRIQVVVADQDVDKLVQVIIDAAKTGNVGDGKIFITPVHDVIRIRTGEKGEKAV